MLQDQRYTLFGFSKQLDWRPLHFVEPIPAHRICDACGLLPRVTVFLPCRHVLCKTCYEHCLLDNGPACPLDGDQFLEGDAQWVDFPLENLLSRKVKCWNEDNGCELAMAAADLSEHFYEDCVHHSARCPKCSAYVLWKNMCAHRKSDCHTHAPPNMTEYLNPRNGSVQDGVCVALERILEERIGELRFDFDTVVRDSSALCDRLNEFSHVINDLREKVMQSLEKQSPATDDNLPSDKGRIATVKDLDEGLAKHGDMLSQRLSALGDEVKTGVVHAARQSLEMVEHNSAELKRHSATHGGLLHEITQTVKSFEVILEKALERATETISLMCSTNAQRFVASNAAQTQSKQSASDVKKDLLLGHNTLKVTCYEFYVKGIKSLKEKARLTGWSTYYSDPVYLCGYCICPGVYLKKSDSSVFVHGLYRIHKGVIDEFLQWPFNNNFKIGFKNLSKGRSREISNRIGQSLQVYGKPTESMNVATYFYKGCDIEDLERECYVESDELWVKFEVVPTTPD